MAAQRAFGTHSKTVEKATGNMAAGSRVRSAADDAASLAIGTKIRADKRSGMQAIRNGNDAMTKLQVAEGSMSEMSSILTRLRELSVQASTDILDGAQREMLNLEYDQLSKEMERLAQTTDYNGEKLLQGDYQIGIHNDFQSVIHVDMEYMAATRKDLGIAGTSLGSKEASQENLSKIDGAIESLTSKRAFSGAIATRLQSSISNLTTTDNQSAAIQSRMMDADMAYEASEKLRGELQMQATGSLLTQVNNMGRTTLKLLE